MRVVARFGSDFLKLSGSSQQMLVCWKFVFNDEANDDECCLKGRRGVLGKII